MNLQSAYHGMMAVCQGRVHLMHWHGIHARHLVFLFPFHPPVLEPDLDLSLCQTQRMRDLDPEMEVITN